MLSYLLGIRLFKISGDAGRIREHLVAAGFYYAGLRYVGSVIGPGGVGNGEGNTGDRQCLLVIAHR